MTRTITLLAAAGTAVAVWTVAAFAADQDATALPEKPQASVQNVQKLVRHETLELPGLTACHQCEWRPHLHEQAAADQCGFLPDGTAKVGQFECGFSPDCERICNFLSCLQ